jgi:very-short-patch-repair endonuclease
MGELRGDRAIAALAARQQGMVTTAQLAAAGIGRDGVAFRVREGRLLRRHRGVYQVGPVAGARAREMAAVLACAGSAVLSHESAAAVWGFRPAYRGDVQLTVTGADARSRAGIEVHQTRALDPSDAASRDGLPLTAPERTLLDLASRLGQRDLDRAAEQAQVLRLTTAASLGAFLRRRPGRRGAAALRQVLATDPAFTRSKAEQRLLELIRAARLPRPETNVRVNGYEVDFAWRAQKVIVEVDGYAFHGSRQAFERDRSRDAHLTRDGYRVVRLTWRQITREPEAVIAILARILA